MIIGSAMLTAPGNTDVFDSGYGGSYSSIVMGITGGAPDCTAILETSPDGQTWTTRVNAVGGGRWGFVASDVSDRLIRVNVPDIGSGDSVSVVISGVIKYGTPGPPESVPPPGTLTMTPWDTAYKWAVAVDPVFQMPSITDMPVFGSAMADAAPVTSMDITNNIGGQIAPSGNGFLLVVSDQLVNFTVTDTAGDSWYLNTYAGDIGYFVNISTPWITHGHTPSDVITIAADQPTKMIGMAAMLPNPGNGFSNGSNVNGFGKQPWVYMPSNSGESVVVVASPQGQVPPGSPDSGTYQNVCNVQGQSMSCSVSWGTP